MLDILYVKKCVILYVPSDCLNILSNLPLSDSVATRKGPLLKNLVSLFLETRAPKDALFSVEDVRVPFERAARFRALSLTLSFSLFF